MPASFSGVDGRLLLASHDTAGAQAAEALALDLATGGGTILHLIVVPEFWKGMRGDDWLSNAITVERFGTYIEDQLGREMETHVRRLSAEAAQRGIRYSAIARQGDISAAVIELAAESACTMVLIGSPRHKGLLGYRSRLDVERLTRSLRVPLLIAPHPAARSAP